MDRLDKFERVEFVEYMPDPTEYEWGVLYISIPFGLAICLCPDGSGYPAVMPLKPRDPQGWDYEEENGKVTLSPSIATNCPNGGHFYIKKNKIVWV